MARYCKSPEQARSEIEEWLATAPGTSHPNDWYNQCSALVQSYSEALFGLNNKQTIGWGHAKSHVANSSSEYFEKVWNDPRKPNLLPQRGDIISWEGLPLWGGETFGHTGVVTAPGSSTVTILQQDGAAPPAKLHPDGNYYSVKAAHLASFAYVGSASVGSVVGWIRPKWQKVRYTGADKRGYGKPPADSAPPAVADVQDFIDVSDWQPGDVVRNVKTDAVVIKATEGASWKATLLDAHVKAAKAKGIPFQLYHFARASKNGSDAEAAHFLRASRPYMSDPLFSGLVLDWEEDSVMHYALWASDFLAYLRRHAPGTHLVIYTRAAFLSASGWRAIDKSVPIWLAAYGNDQRMNGYATDFAGAPQGRNGFSISAWQYTQHGYLPGYASNLDLNRALTGAMWPQKTGAKTLAPKTETLLEWIVSHEETVRKIIREEVSGTINHLTAQVDERGKNVMGRLAANGAKGVLAARIGGTEQAPGEMTLGESWKWDRHERAMNAGQRTEVAAIKKGVDTLAMGVLRILGKLSPTSNGAHAAEPASPEVATKQEA